jgi:hypothetical protein
MAEEDVYALMSKQRLELLKKVVIKDIGQLINQYIDYDYFYVVAETILENICVPPVKMMDNEYAIKLFNRTLQALIDGFTIFLVKEEYPLTGDLLHDVKDALRKKDCTSEKCTRASEDARTRFINMVKYTLCEIFGNNRNTTMKISDIIDMSFGAVGYRFSGVVWPTNPDKTLFLSKPKKSAYNDSCDTYSPHSCGSDTSSIAGEGDSISSSPPKKCKAAVPKCSRGGYSYGKPVDRFSHSCSDSD